MANSLQWRIIMDEKKWNAVKLNGEELSQVTGGIPYEKPVLILLDEIFGACNTGTVCKIGDFNTDLCKNGGSCKVGGF
jgi:hypothetical protein